MDKLKFKNLVKDIEEEKYDNRLKKIGKVEPEVEASPSFKMGLKWFQIFHLII